MFGRVYDHTYGTAPPVWVCACEPCGNWLTRTYISFGGKLGFSPLSLCNRPAPSGPLATCSPCARQARPRGSAAGRSSVSGTPARTAAGLISPPPSVPVARVVSNEISCRCKHIPDAFRPSRRQHTLVSLTYHRNVPRRLYTVSTSRDSVCTRIGMIQTNHRTAACRNVTGPAFHDRCNKKTRLRACVRISFETSRGRRCSLGGTTY